MRTEIERLRRESRKEKADAASGKVTGTRCQDEEYDTKLTIPGMIV